MRTIGTEIFESARRTQAWLLGVLGLLVAFSSFWITPNSTLPTRWVVVAGTPLVVLAVVLVDLTIRLHRQTGVRLPPVRAVHSRAAAKGDSHLLLLLAASELFGHQVAVSIYSRIDEFEVMIGIGFVSTIQVDGTIQVEVSKRVSAYDDVWTQVKSNDRRALQALVVKPSVPLETHSLEEFV